MVPLVVTVDHVPGVAGGANTSIDRAALEPTRVGAGTKIDDLVMIGHNCTIGRHSILCGQVGLAGSTNVGNQVVLAGQVGVRGHVTVGDGAKVGAQSGVAGDVAPGAELFGSPHMNAKDHMRSWIEFRKLPETARLVRKLAKAAGVKDGER
jgi:UDP-3-O-[3-hydroxymyristoyl] glucosamine N-acyltransferase